MQGRKVDHRIGLGLDDCFDRFIAVADVDRCQLDLVASRADVLGHAEAQVVENDHVVAACDEVLGECRTDEAESAGDHCACFSHLSSWTRVPTMGPSDSLLSGLMSARDLACRW